MRILEKHGFTVSELTKEDAEEIFGVLEPDLGRDENKTTQAKKRRVINREIDFSFKEDGHHIIGIRINDELIGIATCNSDGGIPWLGHFSIKEKYRKTKAAPLLLYYIMGIVYPDKIIQTKPIGDTSDYEHVIKKLPKQLGFHILNPEKFKVLKKIAGE